MIIPLRTDSPLRTSPYMNWGLLGANFAVFFATLNNPHLADAMALYPRQPHVYQFITYQFIHADWMHILSNMLFLYIFGNNVNDRLGNLGYLALYLGGGVFAGLSYVVTSHMDRTVVGASGSVFAVTGAFLVLLPRSNITIVYFFYLVGMAEIAAIWFVLGFFALAVFENVSSHDNIAHIAHIGGTIYGVGICMGLLALRLVPRDPFDVLSLLQRWNRRRQYRDLVAGGYDPFEYTQPGRTAVSSSRPARAVTPQSAEANAVRLTIGEALAANDLPAAATLYARLRALDPQQVLPRQQQFDLATYLASEQRHGEAAEAYEAFLRLYPKSEKVDEVELILGLIYSRYLNRPDRARELLTRAITRYHTTSKMQLARDELERLGDGK